jgi:hypothetical protein
VGRFHVHQRSCPGKHLRKGLLWNRLPATITLREVRDGNRWLVTTLCDLTAVAAQEIGWLSCQR